MNKLDKQYTDLLQDILDNGITKQDRTGTGTISIFGRQIRHKMSDGFPLLTTKKMSFKTIVTELLWFLRGDTNIKWLLEQGNTIWVGDAYKNYCKNFIGHDDIPSKEWFIEEIKSNNEFALKFGDLGPIYGKQWRNWKSKPWIPSSYINENNEPTINGSTSKYGGGTREIRVNYSDIDQIQNLINDLKTNPDSRRLMVNAWNVGELDQMVLPPCHYGFQVYTRELSHKERCDLFGHNDSIDRDYSYSKWLDDNGFPTRVISLMWNQRSVDTFLGLPFNIASYGLLLEIIAKEVNMVPDELIGNLGDVHLYSNHIEQAKEQIGRIYTEEERQDMFQTTGMDAMSACDRKTELYNMVPKRTREPYPLPTLKHMKTNNFYKSLSESISLFTHLDNKDFMLENYQSHPSIKAPLSN